MNIPGRNVWRFKSTNPYRTKVETYLQKLEECQVWLDVSPGQGSHSGNKLFVMGFNNYMDDRYTFPVPNSPTGYVFEIGSASFNGESVRVDVSIIENTPPGIPKRTLIEYSVVYGVWPEPERFMKDVSNAVLAHVNNVMACANSIL